MRGLEEVGNEIVEKQKALKEAQTSQYEVEDKILRLQREILNKQGEKKDLEITAGKGRYNIRQLNLDIKIKTSEFWSLKT